MLKQYYSNYFILIFFLMSFSLQSQDLNYYLPDSLEYDSNIPTPKEVLGFEVGEQHANYEQVWYYLQVLSRASERIKIEKYGKTYEQKPLILLTITHPENHKNIDKIQKEHLKLSNPSLAKNLVIDKMPLVVWTGYGVHGDEASATNSALISAYYLATAQGQSIEKLLRNTIILLEPCYNPDGFNRFTSWVNMNRHKNTVTDPISREFNQPFPKGRTNHYWFDLNRDWIPLQLIESQARIKKYHQWKPNILTDHHEMGKNSTFFFQPGVPSRTNPLTPIKNQELTEHIANYHAHFLDRIGSLYYSKENFDDFYYGKGSTYPDIQGGVGILFEQAGVQGYAQETNNGILTFPFSIRNQFTVMLSTLEAGLNLRKELLIYQRDFYQNALKEAQENSTKAYIFGDENDEVKTLHLVKLLRQHQIKVYESTQNNTINKKIFKSHKSYIVPLKQPQYRLIQSLFEKQIQFQDSLFYDVSAWCMPLAFDIPYAEIRKNYYQPSENQFIDNVKFPKSQLTESEKNYAYLIEWNAYDAPKFLYQVQNYNLLTKVALQDFTLIVQNKKRIFKKGTILIPCINQAIGADSVSKILRQISLKCKGVKIWGVSSGKSLEGISLGSNQFKNLNKPSILLIVGQGVRAYDAGEIWFLGDQLFDIPIICIDIQHLSKVDFQHYTTIILVHGNYGMISSGSKERLRDWLRKGGSMLLFKEAVRWGDINRFNHVTFKMQKNNNSTLTLPYESKKENKGSQRIGGAIFEGKADLTHPLFFGYSRSKIPIFKKDALIMGLSSNPYSSPFHFTEKPLLSGYISNQNLKIIQKSTILNVSSYGKGNVISFAENPNFRAFWYGTTKLFWNAVFFGNIINTNY